MMADGDHRMMIATLRRGRPACARRHGLTAPSASSGSGRRPRVRDPPPPNRGLWPERHRPNEDAGEQEVDVGHALGIDCPIAPPNTQVKSRTNMIGCTVEKISSCAGGRSGEGFAGSPPGVGQRAAGRRRSGAPAGATRSSGRRLSSPSRRRPDRAGGAVLARGFPAAEEHVVERRASYGEIAGGDARIAQRPRSRSHQLNAVATGRHRARPVGRLGITATDRGQRRPRAVLFAGSGELNSRPAADAIFELVGSALGDHPPWSMRRYDRQAGRPPRYWW